MPPSGHPLAAPTNKSVVRPKIMSGASYEAVGAILEKCVQEQETAYNVGTPKDWPGFCSRPFRMTPEKMVIHMPSNIAALFLEFHQQTNPIYLLLTSWVSLVKRRGAPAVFLSGCCRCEVLNTQQGQSILLEVMCAGMACHPPWWDSQQ